MSLRRTLLAVLLAGGLTTAASAQCDTSFTLVNQSGVTVQEFYFGSSAQQSWGQDQLGQSVLPNGQSMNFRARAAGRNDFRVIWANGERADLMSVDICATSQIIATPTGISARPRCRPQRRGSKVAGQGLGRLIGQAMARRAGGGYAGSTNSRR